MLRTMAIPGLLFMLMVSLPGCGNEGSVRTHLYVSPSGDDAGPGTESLPFRTLERARDEIRVMRRGSGWPAGGVTVVLREGEHVRDSPFQLGPEDSGEEGAPVTYTTYAGEQAVVTGGKRITGWAPVDGPVQGMPPGMQGRIYAAPVGQGWQFHFLYVNGEPQRISRLYNSDEWFSWPKPERIGPTGPQGQKIGFRPGELDGLQGLDGQIEMNLLPVNYWNTLSVLRDIDPVRSTATRHSTNPTTFWKDSFQEGNYNLVNAVRFIDEPGEWALDTTRGMVYLLPSAGTVRPEDVVVAPVPFRLVELQGDSVRPVCNIRFRGLEFRYTDRMPEDIWPEDWIKRQAELPDGMIRGEHVEDVEITECRFLRSGSYAIDLEKHAMGVTIERNEMAYPGCGGVLLQGHGPGSKHVNRGNTIAFNHIHHTGAGGYLHSAAITLYQSGSNEIAFNVVHDVPYVGVQICGANWDAYTGGTGPGILDTLDPGGIDSYGRARAQYQTRWEDLPEGRMSRFTRESFKPYLHASDNRVHHNIITDYLMVLSDGAPLYSWSSGMGNLYYNNLMRRRPTAIEGQKWVFAIYMDDNVDGAVLFGNVVWAQTHPGTIFNNKGQNMWSQNEHRFPEKPAGYDILLGEILRRGEQQGGWAGPLPGELARPAQHEIR